MSSVLPRELYALISSYTASGNWITRHDCKHDPYEKLCCKLSELAGNVHHFTHQQHLDISFTRCNGLLHSIKDAPAVKSLYSDEWWFHGVLHREDDAPAIETRFGTKEWWVGGVRHRAGNQPAVEKDGHKEWWYYGQLHRDGAPAVESLNRKEWWVNGARHRTGDRPAVQTWCANEWWVNGARHRDGGAPAIETMFGDKEWWVDGILKRKRDLNAIENHVFNLTRLQIAFHNNV